MNLGYRKYAAIFILSFVFLLSIYFEIPRTITKTFIHKTFMNAGTVSIQTKKEEILKFLKQISPLKGRNETDTLSLSKATNQAVYKKKTSHTPSATIQDDKGCPSVLKYMTTGSWKPRQVTLEEAVAMEVFLFKARDQYGLPASLQRPDGICGNTSFDDPKLHWFRPLCDPKGPTPCCFHNLCANKNVKECVCNNCFDLRTSINAEYANWIPSNKHCLIPDRTNTQLCQILDRLKIIFIGDSFIRHIYLASILLLEGNLHDGAMNIWAPKDLHDACTGFYMFTEKQCRPLLQSLPVVCNQRVSLQFYEYASAKRGSFIQQLFKSYKNDPSAFFILGTGVHDNFNTTNIWNNYLYPVLNLWKKSLVNPKRLLWHAAHAPGILKTPFEVNQGYDRAKEFNKEIELLLKDYNVPIFKSFNMTDGVNSFDGAHFGQGVNLMKARIIFEYILELRKNSNL